MSQQGKRKTTAKVCWTSIYIAKKVSCVLSEHSQFLCSLARFDLANQCVQAEPAAHVLVFDETLAQPHIAVVNCSDVVMSVFYSPVLTCSLIFCGFELLCCSVACIFFRYPNLER